MALLDINDTVEACTHACTHTHTHTHTHTRGGHLAEVSPKFGDRDVMNPLEDVLHSSQVVKVGNYTSHFHATKIWLVELMR